LQKVPQDPIYHAEGDVYTHTTMVVQELIQLAEWKQLSNTERSVMFIAALLHDVAKPTCTQIDEKGRITSPGHAKRGAKLARQILWELPMMPPLTIRESIVSLVRFHGLPLWFLEKESPDKAVYEASLQIRLDLVALLAEADIRGRICHDQVELLERIQLFREYCQEQGCYDQPRTFPCKYSRFRYFQGWQDNPLYSPYVKPSFEVILMVGLPGSGKDTWIKKNLPDWPIVSLDEIRKQHRIHPEDSQGKVIQLAKEQAKEWLRQKRSFVWNATNLTQFIRKPLIQLFASYQARVRIVYVDIPPQVALDRNRKRTEYVPEKVILKLASKLEVPEHSEAHQVDWISHA
jgi:putative nucleotidyltransferase with HDIG domain